MPTSLAGRKPTGSLIEASVASHTLRREEGSGHTAIIGEERNYQTKWLDNNMLTSAKHAMYCYSMTTDATFEECRSDCSHQVSIVAMIVAA